MESQSLHFRKQRALSVYEDERLQPPPAVTPPRCVSTEMLATTEEDILHHQLGQFWSFAVDLPNRFHQEISHLSQTRDDSLERQFLYQDYLTKPALPETPQPRRKVNYSVSDNLEPDTVLRGEDINDVPCSYVISGLEPHELPVIGTYVDRRVLPGFRYRVRLNQTNEYLFEGRALILLSIGMGYGKRLTFQADCLNENDNYFWSDSRAEGFAFSVVGVQVDDVFDVTSFDNEMSGDNGKMIKVTKVNHQKEIETLVRGNGDIVKKIRVQCEHVDQVENVISNDKTPSELRGVLYLVKTKKSKWCQVERIEVEHGSTLRAKELRPPSLFSS